MYARRPIPVVVCMKPIRIKKNKIEKNFVKKRIHTKYLENQISKNFRSFYLTLSCFAVKMQFFCLAA